MMKDENSRKEGIENAKYEGVHLVLNKGTRIGLLELTVI